MTEPKPTYMSEWHDQITDTYYLKCDDVTITLEEGHPYRSEKKDTLIRAARIAYLRMEHDGMEFTPENWLITIGKEIENDHREGEWWQKHKLERLNERQAV